MDVRAKFNIDDEGLLHFKEALEYFIHIGIDFATYDDEFCYPEITDNEYKEFINNKYILRETVKKLNTCFFKLDPRLEYLNKKFFDDLFQNKLGKQEKHKNVHICILEQFLKYYYKKQLNHTNMDIEKLKQLKKYIKKENNIFYSLLERERGNTNTLAYRASEQAIINSVYTGNNIFSNLIHAQHIVYPFLEGQQNSIVGQVYLQFKNKNIVLKELFERRIDRLSSVLYDIFLDIEFKPL